MEVSVELKQKWEEFKQKFDRNFETEEEELMRFNIFEKNVEMVEKHNLEYEQGLRTFTMGINNFSDWTSEEMSRMCCGMRSE